jgi:glycine/D-amino acid oxidase-like deaminating enzyme
MDHRDLAAFSVLRTTAGAAERDFFLTIHECGSSFMHRRGRVAVLGAGLTGVGTALELARHGIAVTLIDQDERPMNRASLRNEGKIHLGLIYANAGTLETAGMQLQGALRFRSLVSRWIGNHALRRSTRFWYLVANDSILTVDELADHYAAVDSMYTAYLREDRTLDYLGERPATLWHRSHPCDLRRFFTSERLLGGFETEERAIDTAELAQYLVQAVAESPLIEFLPAHRVHGVEARNGAWRVEGSRPGGAWQLEVDQVVNALWENRLAIDQTAGFPVETGWLYRLKYRVIAALPERLREAPSATMVIGPYGDVVVRPDATAYLSWYPLGLRGWTHDLNPPAAWTAPCRGEVPADDFRSTAADFMKHIDAWYPGIGECVPLQVDAGAIVAYGHTDVGDRASALHDRSRIGVVSVDGYHTVEPGKLTTAPLVAEQAAARVMGEAVVA